MPAVRVWSSAQSECYLADNDLTDEGARLFAEAFTGCAADGDEEQEEEQDPEAASFSSWMSDVGCPLEGLMSLSSGSSSVSAAPADLHVVDLSSAPCRAHARRTPRRCDSPAPNREKLRQLVPQHALRIG